MCKHQKLVDILNRELSKKHYITWLEKNVEYARGECDVLAVQNGRLVYYEVKSNHSLKGFKKAYNQIQRWLKFSGENYGVYYTPQYMKLIRRD